MAYGIVDSGVEEQWRQPFLGSRASARVSWLWASTQPRDSVGGAAVTIDGSPEKIVVDGSMAVRIDSTAKRIYSLTADTLIGAQSFTLVWRLKQSSTVMNGGTMFKSNGTSGSQNRIDIYSLSSGVVRCDMYNSSGLPTIADSAAVLAVDGLYTVALVYDYAASSLQWYVNGAASGSPATPGTRTGAGTLLEFGGGGAGQPANQDYSLLAVLPYAASAGRNREIHRNPWQLFEADNDPVFYSLGGGATDYPVTATDALTLADSASNVASLGAAGSDALTLADSVSNVAALSATATDALSLADSASNVAALSATASDALTLADTLNATASGDYTATGSDALTLADSAANAAALGATGTDALTLADAASNTAALGATAADALTLADTLNASASGDYVAVATDALSLSDSVVAAYAAICIATDALTLADATSAAMAGEYAATATDALTLADAASNAAALGVSISEALTLAALVSAMLTGNTALTGTRGGYGVQMQLAARRAQIQTGRCRN